MKLAPLRLCAFALVLVGALTGCRSLDPAGPYAGDKVLYHAELVTTTSYDVIHTFVTWEKENRAALAVWPEIRRSADTMRKMAPGWFQSAYALRDAYAADPTSANRENLERALTILRAALTEAAAHLAKAAT